MCNNIITTVEELKSIVSEGGWVTEHFTPKGACVEVLGGIVDLENATIKGMEIYFNNCTIKGRKKGGGFNNCKLSIDNESTVDKVIFHNSEVHIRNSKMCNVPFNGGSLSILKGVHVEDSTLFPLSLQATQEQVVAIHKDGNVLGKTVTLTPATATISNFGTYNGNVHYFKDSDTVIAGCWQGKLENFKWKARKRGVAKDSYEAVYNYFKSFN